ncbi:hypothetical protein C8T65DRAFT_109562 [Cerioporus squamosus]|nr:hypothetical protein C8T65DRAFT_109562 [Cerioporus squamosus]
MRTYVSLRTARACSWVATLFQNVVCALQSLSIDTHACCAACAVASAVRIQYCLMQYVFRVYLHAGIHPTKTPSARISRKSLLPWAAEVTISRASGTLGAPSTFFPALHARDGPVEALDVRRSCPLLLFLLPLQLFRCCRARLKSLRSKFAPRPANLLHAPSPPRQCTCVEYEPRPRPRPRAAATMCRRAGLQLQDSTVDVPHPKHGR